MLKLNIDTLESVDEPLRSLYEPKDGKFALRVEGVEDTSGLKSALASERQLRAKAERDSATLRSLGKTPEEIQGIIAERAKADEDAAKKAGDFDSILKQKQEQWSAETARLKSELDAALTSERNAIIGTAVTSALSKAGVTEEGLDLIPDRLQSRIRYETMDGSRVLKIMQADGVTPMAGSGKDGSATFDDLVKEAVEKWGSLFKRIENNGSGKLPNSSGAGSPQHTGNLAGTIPQRLAAISKRFPNLPS